MTINPVHLPGKYYGPTNIGLTSAQQLDLDGMSPYGDF